MWTSASHRLSANFNCQVEFYCIWRERQKLSSNSGRFFSFVHWRFQKICTASCCAGCNMWLYGGNSPNRFISYLPTANTCFPVISSLWNGIVKFTGTDQSNCAWPLQLNYPCNVLIHVCSFFLVNGEYPVRKETKQTITETTTKYATKRLCNAQCAWITIFKMPENGHRKCVYSVCTKMVFCTIALTEKVL